MLGPLKMVVKKRGARLKLWLLLTRCLSTGHVSITIMLSMTAEALLQALQQAWYSVGCATSHEVHSDKGSNIVPLTDAVSDQSEDLNTTGILNELKGVLQKKNILFKQCPAYSHHRMGAVERICGLVKIALKRSQLKDKSLMLQDWLYVVKRIE